MRQSISAVPYLVIIELLDLLVTSSIKIKVQAYYIFSSNLSFQYETIYETNIAICALLHKYASLMIHTLPYPIPFFITTDKYVYVSIVTYYYD